MAAGVRGGVPPLPPRLEEPSRCSTQREAQACFKKVRAYLGADEEERKSSSLNEMFEALDNLILPEGGLERSRRRRLLSKLEKLAADQTSVPLPPGTTTTKGTAGTVRGTGTTAARGAGTIGRSAKTFRSSGTTGKMISKIGGGGGST